MSTNENNHSKEHKAHKSGTTHNKKEKRIPLTMSQLRSVGAVLSLIQAVVGGVFIYLLNRTGMIPWKYVMSAFAIVSVAVLAVVLLVCLRNRKARIAAIVLSVIIIFVHGYGKLLPLSDHEPAQKFREFPQDRLSGYCRPKQR